MYTAQPPQGGTPAGYGQPLPPPPVGGYASPMQPDPSSSNFVATYGVGPETKSYSMDGKKYKLEVAQSPQRARMCGFGDKDRRPITPPPCVKLILIDEATGDELPVDQIDTSFFILTVDLWSADGRQENNLIKTMNPAASIGTSEAGSFTNVSTLAGQGAMGPPMAPPGSVVMYHHPMYGGGMPAPPSPYSAFPMQYTIAPSPTSPYPTSAGVPMYFPVHSTMHPAPTSHAPPHMQQAAVGMFSRNLVGSLASSAFVLEDDKGKKGIWFILSDLSVRSEGVYRLKLNFCFIGTKSTVIGGTNGTAENGTNGTKPKKTGTSGGIQQNAVLNEGAAPILASTFSEPFTVYSAKKFPGVSESTELSKKFAAQGIKLPIRKSEMRRSGPGDENYDSDD